MNINGVTPHRASRKIKIRGIEFVITAVPIGFEREYNKVYPEPSPPVKEITKAGKVPERVTIWDDTAFLDELKEWKYYKNVYLFWKVTSSTPGIRYDVTPIDKASLIHFANELNESGISEGDMSNILEQVVELTTVTQEELEDTKKNS